MLLALEYETLSVCIAKINPNAYGICTSGVCMIACALGFTQKDAVRVAAGYPKVPNHRSGVEVGGFLVVGIRVSKKAW